jgi:hypothetical protein
MPPHPDHEHIKSNAHEHKSGYPFEELQVGNPGKIDSNEAYLHIPDVQDTSKYIPHPFDEHPIHAVQDLSQGDFNKVAEKFASDMQNWHDSEHVKNWGQKIKEEHAGDPEAFKLRGKAKPEKIYDDKDIKTMPHHQHEMPKGFYINMKENKTQHHELKPSDYEHLPKRGKADQPATTQAQPATAQPTAQPKPDWRAKMAQIKSGGQ